MPDPTVGGKTFKTERPPGMIFYNGIGDECGGLVFGAATGENARAGDKYGAYGGVTFCSYKKTPGIGRFFKHQPRTRQAQAERWGSAPSPQSVFILDGRAVLKKRTGPQRQI